MIGLTEMEFGLARRFQADVAEADSEILRQRRELKRAGVEIAALRKALAVERARNVQLQIAADLARERH